MKVESENIKRILVINLGGIGDVLISTPALRALKEHFSGCQLYLLVVGRVAGIVRDLPYVDKVFVFEVERPWLNLFANLKNILELRKLRIDLGINMRTLVSWSSARKVKFILGLISPRIKAGRDTSGRGDFFDIKIPEEDIGDKYEMEYDLEIVRALGAKADNRQIDFVIDPESLKSADKLLRDNGIKESDILIGIHPGGKPSHRWPLGNFVEVMKTIQQKTGGKFFVTGSLEETKLAESLLRESGINGLNLSGKLTIRELAAVLKRCNLYITNDTGSMHIAAILRRPLVAVFGPGYINRYDPRHIDPNAAVLYKKIYCAPCNKEQCLPLACLRAISVEEVVKESVPLLERNTA